MLRAPGVPVPRPGFGSHARASPLNWAESFQSRLRAGAPPWAAVRSAGFATLAQRPQTSRPSSRVNRASSHRQNSKSMASSLPREPGLDRVADCSSLSQAICHLRRSQEIPRNSSLSSQVVARAISVASVSASRNGELFIYGDLFTDILRSCSFGARKACLKMIWGDPERRETRRHAPTADVARTGPAAALFLEDRRPAPPMPSGFRCAKAEMRHQRSRLLEVLLAAGLLAFLRILGGLFGLLTHGCSLFPASCYPMLPGSRQLARLEDRPVICPDEKTAADTKSGNQQHAGSRP